MDFKILGTEVDKKGSILVIKHSESLAFSPAYTFFIRQVADLIDNNHGMPYTLWNDDDCEIVWAEIEGKIVGMICYENTYVNDPIPFLAIQLTAVHDEYRQRGIHTVLNTYFEKRAKELNCVAIRATVHVTNTVRLESTKKDKLNPLLTVMYKSLV
jgi:GNAT superfamily N-acetyltransferase